MRDRVLLAALLLLPAAAARAQNPGVVTPTEVTTHVTSVSLVTVDQHYVGLVNDPFDFTFRRSDPDFAAVPLRDAEVPVGRYGAVSLCFRNRQELLLDGVTFDGRDGAALKHGDKLFSQAGGPVTATPTAATAVAFGAGDQQYCASTTLRRPVCLTADRTGCQPGDEVIGGAAPDGGTPDGGVAEVEASLSIHLLLDLYHAVTVDADSGAIQAAPAPFVTLGDPGAGIHLASFDPQSQTSADVTMLFAPDQQLIAAFVSKWPQQGGMDGLCPGPSAVFASAAPAGAPPLPQGGPVYISAFDASGTGTLQIPAMGGACRDVSDVTQCVANSINVITDLLQPAGSDAHVRCVAAADATPPFLGYTYRHGDHGGGDGSTVTLPIARVVDPSALFGLCPKDAPHAVAGHPGTCSASASPDGY